MIPTLNISTNYQGYLKVNANDPYLAEIYADGTANPFGLIENQGLIVCNDDGGTYEYRWKHGKLERVVRKPVESMQIGKVRAKNPEQALAIDMMMDPNITVKVMTGGFGTGKSYIGCACAMSLIQQGKYDKILWVRNNIEVKDSNPIGYLKGSFMDKMIVWAMPLADHVGGREALEQMIERGQLEIEHLGFLRGRDIKNSIIFCSEAEHLTRQHVQLLLGRVSGGSVLLLEGDCTQIDQRAFEQDNGLEAAINRLKGNPLFGYTHLQESVRSETAKLADLLNK